MAGASRWADTEEDAVLEARRRKEKEDKKRQKEEKARRVKAAEDAQKATVDSSEGAGEGDRPAKRRRLTPDRGEPDTNEAKLLRFPDRSWRICRSVERYSKLNDIEEGTYGWVSRAKDTATGTVVALKRLKAEPSDRNGLPVTGLREIQILRDCSHDNIVKLREVVVGDDTSKIERSAHPRLPPYPVHLAGRC
jgi:cell division cycle 2-like